MKISSSFFVCGKDQLLFPIVRKTRTIKTSSNGVILKSC